jgi:hypothetical protein
LFLVRFEGAIMPFITQWKEKPQDNGPDGSARRIEKGALENARRTVMSTLQERFGVIPLEVWDALESIHNPNGLTTLMRLAVKVKTLKEFLNELEK